MNRERSVFLLILLLGLVATAAFHSSGAVDERDALLAASLEGAAGVPSPPPLTGRALALGVEATRLVSAEAGLFRGMHWGAGILLALAAALSGLVAYRGAGGAAGPGLASALLVGTALLFGADTGRLGLQGSPLPVTLALVAGAVVAWTAKRPRAFLGGLLYGAALAECAWLLFTLPGFLPLALSAALRVEPDRGARLQAAAAAGVIGGWLAVFLLVPFSLGAWISGPGGAFWSFAGPGAWGEGLAGWLGALWRNAGPVGIAAGLAGVAHFSLGSAPALRPFLLIHAIPALALVIGRPGDRELAEALTVWPFLFWTVPAIVGLSRRLDEGLGKWVPAVGLASGVFLLAMNGLTIDRSSERTIDWATDCLTPLSEDAILFTSNPVHLVAAEIHRPDVRVVYTRLPETVNRLARDEELGIPPPPDAPELPATYLRAILDLNDTAPIFVAPSLHFDPDARARLMTDRWQLVPHGLAFRPLPVGANVDRKIDRKALNAWFEYHLELPSAPSGLRDGLGGSEYYARGLLESAAILLEEKLYPEAENHFLLALSLPAASPTMAAYGLAQIYYRKRNYGEAAQVLQANVEDRHPQALPALELLGNSYDLAGKRSEAIVAYQRALGVAKDPRKREMLEQRLASLTREDG